jgi:hypothetical protein
VPNALNPQALNRYAYVLNNPLKYTDPTGHAQACADGDLGGGCGSPGIYKPPEKHAPSKPERTPIYDPTRWMFPPLLPSSTPCPMFGCGNWTPPKTPIPVGTRGSTPPVTIGPVPESSSPVSVSPWDKFWMTHRPGGIVMGANAGGDLINGGVIFGTEMFVTQLNNEVPFYSEGMVIYGGGGPSKGVGGSGSAYAGVILNVDPSFQVSGNYISYQATLSVPGGGISIVNTIPRGNLPLAPDVPQSVTIGYAPGARVSGGAYLIRAEPFLFGGGPAWR